MANLDCYGVLDTLGIFDTQAEPEFDNLVVAAAALCNTPVSLISLVHRDRQWFKARVGFEPHETPINQSVCAHALNSLELLVIPDLTQDPRTRDNTLVTGDPHIRFYAGAPLVVDGVAIGSLCVIDTVVRPDGLTAEQAHALAALASQVVTQIEAQRNQRIWAEEIEARNAALAQSASLAMALVRLGDRLQSATSEEEAVRAGSTVMAETLGATRAGFGIVDPERETVMMQPDWRAPGVSSLAGLHSFRDYGSFIEDLKRGEMIIIPDVAADPRTAGHADVLTGIGIRVLINVPVFQHGRFVLVGFVHYDWSRPLDDREEAFIRTVADRIQSAIAQIRAVEDRRILNREMSHRLKNTFAMISAIARQTFGGQNRDALRNFGERLSAVSAAYDLLAHERWQATDLAAVMTAVAGIVGAGERLTHDGPQVHLGADSALTTAMLLHELATNALKYGALSVTEGQVQIAWAQDGDDVVMYWQESGGPVVVPPTRTGFGSRLIGMGLGGSVPTVVDYAPTGLCVTVRAPLLQLQR